MKSKDISTEYLKQRLLYDCDTGVFTRIKTPRKDRLGKEAGSLGVLGYTQIYLNGTLHYAHRLAWLYVYGEYPKNMIDHVDGNRANNAISNLRDVTSQGNRQNMRRAMRDNKTGLLGASKSRKGYVAQICINGKQTYLGLYETALLAHEAYLSVKREVHKTCTI